MSRDRGDDRGFTVYQLLVSIVVLVVLGSLWLAYDQHQKTKRNQSLTLTEQICLG